jgi:hypothetical protein
MKQYLKTTEVTETPESNGKDITNTINNKSPLSDSKCIQWLNPFII